MTSDEDPFWRCPKCGCEWFRVPVVFEKGLWTDDDTYEFEYPDTGIVNTVRTSAAECVQCGYTFDIGQHFGWIKPAEAPD